MNPMCGGFSSCILIGLNGKTGAECCKVGEIVYGVRVGTKNDEISS